MRAAKTTSGYWHWVHPDAVHTLCGRALVSMRVERELEFDHLPADGRVCVPCEAVRQGDDYVERGVTLTPSYGFLRKEGPISNTAKSRGIRKAGSQRLRP